MKLKVIKLVNSRAKIQSWDYLIYKAHIYLLFFSCWIILCKVIPKWLKKETIRLLLHKASGSTLHTKSNKCSVLTRFGSCLQISEKCLEESFILITALCRGRVSLRKNFFVRGAWNFLWAALSRRVIRIYFQLYTRISRLQYS